MFFSFIINILFEFIFKIIKHKLKMSILNIRIKNINIKNPNQLNNYQTNIYLKIFNSSPIIADIDTLDGILVSINFFISFI